MFKNLIFAFVLLGTYASAIEMELHQSIYEQNRDDSRKHDVRISDYIATEQDWIAVYKSDASNEWENVIVWRWIKGLIDYAPPAGEPAGKVWHDVIQGLPIGEYEVRLFRKNSYDVASSLAFTVTKEIPNIEIRSYYNRATHTIKNQLRLAVSYKEKSQDWLGLYKVGDSNDWENVKKWVWAKDLPTDQFRAKNWLINTNDIEQDEGEYEVRYFLNNSFTTYAKSEEVIEVSNPIQTTVELGDIIQTALNDADLTVSYQNIKRTSNKDWIALVKNDDDYYRDSNIVTWKYLDHMNESGSVDFVVHPRYWKGKKLKAIIYKDNGYETIAQGSREY